MREGEGTEKRGIGFTMSVLHNPLTCVAWLNSSICTDIYSIIYMNKYSQLHGGLRGNSLPLESRF